jgi:xylulose-5-phosphate/fructose-6-phosphate phosphoketolase
MHREMAATLDRVVREVHRIWADARERGVRKRPIWPMIVLRTPKGWTCPREIDGKLCEGYWRSHQVPVGDMDRPEHIAVLEQWMRSYRPEELFDEAGHGGAERPRSFPPGGGRDRPRAAARGAGRVLQAGDP